MGTIANAKVTHYYNCYNGDFIGCLQKTLHISFQGSPRFLLMEVIKVIWLHGMRQVCSGIENDSQPQRKLQEIQCHS